VSNLLSGLLQSIRLLDQFTRTGEKPDSSCPKSKFHTPQFFLSTIKETFPFLLSIPAKQKQNWRVRSRGVDSCWNSASVWMTHLGSVAGHNAEQTTVLKCSFKVNCRI